MAGLLAEEKDDEREDQAEADGKRERDDVHDVRGLRAGIIARPAAKAPHFLHKTAQNLVPNGLIADD